MMTLITGQPGNGKTALCVAMLQEELEKRPRPVYVVGIPDLVLPHEVAPPVEDWTRQEVVPEDPRLSEAVFTFPDGALVIIDECQKIFRTRAVGSRVPDYVTAFERHRHKGLDFWLLTQHPNLIDSNVRKLIGKHIHVRDTWAGRKLYEWSEATNPDSKSDRDSATVRKYRLPKKVFGLYKSASVHIKHKRRIPVVVWVLVVAVLGGGAAAYHVFRRVDTAIHGGGYAGIDTSHTAASGATSSSEPVSGHGAVLGVREADYVPRLVSRPETAPLYDTIRKPHVMPIVAGCISMRGQCKCYTQQGTDAHLLHDACLAWLAHPPFNPWQKPQDERRDVASRSETSQPVRSASAASTPSYRAVWEGSSARPASAARR